MPENEKVYMSGILLIDKYGNKFCEMNRYEEAVICIVYDAASIIHENVEKFANSKNPNYLPSTNGTYIPILDSLGARVWHDIGPELKLLKMNRIINY